MLPNLHKDYGDLCSANMPVTGILLGSKLQKSKKRTGARP